jgi:hypothetical protein
MDHKLGIHVKTFNDRVRVMNQSRSTNLVLTASDARDLHADIFALLAHMAELSGRPVAATDTVEINLDGGKF